VISELAIMLVDWALDAVLALIIPTRGRTKWSQDAAQRRLLKYRKYQNVMVPFRLDGTDIGEGIESFEIRIFKGYEKKFFGWWNASILGEFGDFLRTMSDVQLEPDGTLKGVCASVDGRSVHVSVQQADMQILLDAFR
jgi:hypothetical protein